MADVNVYDVSGKKVSAKKVDDLVSSETGPNTDLMKQVALGYVANSKKYTASTKTRKEVAGTGAKPYRQKGTGRARAGTAKSPIWRGGGTVFGPHPRDIHTRLPKKMRIAALRESLSGKIVSEEVFLTDGFKLDAPKTKTVNAFLETTGIKGASILLITGDDNVYKSARNIDRVTIKAVEYVNSYDLLRHRFVVATQEDFDTLLTKVKS